MREPGPGDPTDGPQLAVTTTMRKALTGPGRDGEARLLHGGRTTIGIVDREAVLRAISEEGDG